MNQKKKLNKEYKVHFSSLRDLINSWNLIPESPPDEFDSINHMCLSLLYRGANRIKLGAALHHELNTNYGFSVDIHSTDVLAKQVFEWWLTINKVQIND